MSEEKAEEFWKGLLEKIHKLPFYDPEFCPFCFLYTPIVGLRDPCCEECDYGELHGECYDEGSTYKTFINNLIRGTSEEIISNFLDLPNIVEEIEDYEDYYELIYKYREHGKEELVTAIKKIVDIFGDKISIGKKKILISIIKMIPEYILHDRFIEFFKNLDISNISVGESGEITANSLSFLIAEYCCRKERKQGKRKEMREATIEDYEEVMHVLEKINCGEINPRKMVFRIAVLLPSLIVKASKRDLTKEDIL